MKVKTKKRRPALVELKVRSRTQWYTDWITLRGDPALCHRGVLRHFDVPRCPKDGTLAVFSLSSRPRRGFVGPFFAETNGFRYAPIERMLAKLFGIDKKQSRALGARSAQGGTVWMGFKILRRAKKRAAR
jgi:hypothetical protein